MSEDLDERAAALDRVRSFLVGHGATEEEIDQAIEDNVVDLLVAQHMLVPADRLYTVADVERITGMPSELARRLWRALGFSDVSNEEQMFTDLDLEAIFTLQAMVELGVAEVDTALQLARVIGSSMARIAEAEIAPAMVGMPGVDASPDSLLEADRFAALAGSSLPAMARLLEFVWRRHLQAATRRAMLLRSRGSAGNPDLVVGFADMVGFTGLSQQLSGEELAAVVSRFEQVAHDTVTAGGGRVVKMIGDEAMFVSESPVAAARIALALAEAYADDELLSDVRVGMALGPVLVQEGDFFGPVVNLASRAVNIAYPGTVLVSDEFHKALVRAAHPAQSSYEDWALSGSGLESDMSEFEFVALRPRNLKDLGRVHLWVLTRPGAEPPPPERRLGRRWERLSEVLRDIDDLRARGEKAIASKKLGPASSVLGLGHPERGDFSGAQLQAAVDAPEGPSSQVDEPS